MHDALPEKAKLRSKFLSSAYAFVVVFGIVSLFSDMTHEGARSITGPFLSSLGLSAGAVGIIAGLGEFVGYALRFVSGYVSDKTRRYWLVTGVGYAVNLLAVPLLALAGRWEVAALLMILERAGRAIRNPARDAMLSHATKEMGRGKGFGLHEAFDQIGATAGPLIIAAALLLGVSPRKAFAYLLIPAVMGIDALAALLFGRLYDKKGIWALVLSTLISLPFPIFAFQKSSLFPLIGIVLWGVGLIYDRSITAAIVFSLVPQLAAIPFFVLSARRRAADAGGHKK